MRRFFLLLRVFLLVGLAFLLLVLLTDLLVPLLERDEQPLPAEPSVVEDVPVCSDSGWPVCERNGVTALRGVDISEHQAVVDWEALRAAGAQFVMLRMGYRGYTDGGLFEDAHFRANAEAAIDAGLAVGVYFFSQAITEAEAEEEARFVLDALQHLDITWPVAFDWETVSVGGRTDGLSGRDMTACAIAFCSEIRRAGYTPAIYTNQAQWMLYSGYAKDKLDRIVIWMADYGSDPGENSQIWQYTDCGTLDGIDTPVDLNLSFVDYGAR